jgi:short-subunit dehydrogenase
MIAHARGSIINVASIGAFLPAPRNATYNATKAYLVSFSESLQAELRDTGVQIQALCPGFTYTEFHDSPEYVSFERSQIPQQLWSSVDEVVSQSLSALKRGQVVFIPGFKNRLLIALTRNRITAPLLRAASVCIEKRIGLA